jgi:hypothetical protein
MRAQRKKGLQRKEGLAFDSGRGYAFQKKIAKDFEAKIFIGAKNVSPVHKLIYYVALHFGVKCFPVDI